MKTDKLLKLIQQKKAMRSGGALPLPKAQQGIPNPLLNIPESQRFAPVSERTVVYPDNYIQSKLNPGVPLNFMGQPFATGAIEQSVSPLDLIGGVRGGVGLIKGLMKYRQAMKPNYIQIGDELFDMGAHPRAVRRATNQMTKGAKQIVLPTVLKSGGLAKAQKGLQFVPNGTYGNYYDPSTGQYIPQVYLSDVNIVADRELPFQNGKFAPFLASRGVAEYVPLETAFLPGTPVVKGLSKVGNFALDVLNPLAGMNVGKGLKIPKSQWEQIPLDDPRWEFSPKLFDNYKPSDFDRQIKNEAFNYLELTKDPRYLERVRALDAEAKAAGLESNLETKLRRFWQQGDKPEDIALSQDKYLPFNIETAESIPYIDATGNSKDALGLSSYTREGLLNWITSVSQGSAGKNFFPNYRKITINEPRHLAENVPVRGTVHHELKHHWTDALESEPYYSDLLRKSVIPEDANKVLPRKNFGYYSAPTEIDAHLMTNLRDEMVKKGVLKDHFDELTKEKLSTFIKENPEYRGVKEYFKPGEEIVWDRNKFINAFNKALPVVVPGAIGAGALQQIEEQQIGGSSNMKTDKLLQLITNANPRFQKGGGLNDLVVSEMWEKLTGTKWSQAKKLGLTDGSYEKNLQLRNMLAEEAAKPKPNMGKFTGRGTPQVPKASAATRNLTAAALQQTATPRGSTAVNMPVVSAPVAPVAPKPGSRPAMTKEQMAQALDQARGINPAAQSTLTVAQPVIQTPVGRMPMPAEKPVLVPVTPPMGQPTYPQQAEESGSMFPNLSRMATASMLNILPVVSGVQATNAYGPMMIGNKTYEATDKALNVLPSFIGNYARGFLGRPITEENFTDDELRALGHAIYEGEKKGYGVPKNYKDLGYTGSFGYDDYPGRRDAINAFTGLTSPQYWGDGKMGNRLKRIAKGWDDLNAAYSVGMGNFKKNPDGSYTVGDDYNFNRDYVKNNPTSLAERMEKIGFIGGAEAPTTINIPAEYVKKSGGAKRSLKIRIRKNG